MEPEWWEAIGLSKAVAEQLEDIAMRYCLAGVPVSPERLARYVIDPIPSDTLMDGVALEPKVLKRET